MDISNKITIVIPSYNEEFYIYSTLWSISKQKFDGKLKVIIADGNSTDRTLERISRASQDFKNLDIEITEGGMVGVARNNGAQLVNTPYILFVDADSVLIEKDILTETLKYSEAYDIITCKQKSTVSGFKSKLTWDIFNFVRKIMPETFCTGCYFFISKEKFDELGGFDETLNNSEDFWLSRKVSKKYFKILNRYIGQDDRRFKKMGYLNFLKIVILNYWYRNDIRWFKKDVGYWEPYE
jgi:glycosyltransferase involved in cell wall biosynthesis